MKVCLLFSWLVMMWSSNLALCTADQFDPSRNTCWGGQRSSNAWATCLCYASPPSQAIHPTPWLLTNSCVPSSPPSQPIKPYSRSSGRDRYRQSPCSPEPSGSIEGAPWLPTGQWKITLTSRDMASGPVMRSGHTLWPRMCPPYWWPGALAAVTSVCV